MHTQHSKVPLPHFPREAAVDGPARLGSSGGDRELKFALPRSRVDSCRRWLETVCRRDPQFPAAIVWTIYYDTPGLESLREKVDSDYLKRKIRLRWYSNSSGAPAGPVFIEAKSRIGTRRGKIRVEVPHTADDVATWELQDPRLQRFPALLAADGMIVGDLWQPILTARYRRDRFIEPVSRTRVSLDADIGIAAVNHRFLSPADPRTLDIGILEIKGEREELPPALRPLLHLDARQCSFSKYLTLYLHTTHRIL
jgi:hypothetical protein